MSEKPQKRVVSEEERNTNRYSFIVGMVIALVIVILFVIFFNR